MKAGWYAVAWSDEIPVGGVEPLVAGGREYVLFRAEDGTPLVLDAHCRHLGAHLGYGGAVEGAALRCPFHGWRWEADGICSDVPYAKPAEGAKRIPTGARIGAWTACDRNEVVCAWLGGDETPGYEIPELPGSAEGLRSRFRAVGEPDDIASRMFSAERVGGGLGVGSRALVSDRLGGLLFHRVDALSDAGVAIYLTPLDTERVDVRVSAWGGGARDFLAALEAEVSQLEGAVS